MPITARAPLILAEHFPTPRLAIRTTNPAHQDQIRRFSARQAVAANQVLDVLLERLPRCGGHDERVAVLLAAYDLLARWRYETAVAMGSSRAERFRTPISDDDANFDRLGPLGRLRDGARWDARTRTHVGGLATPAFDTLLEFGRRAEARFQREGAGDVLRNHVVLPDGTAVDGNLLLRGAAAQAAAAELIRRQVARGGTGDGFDSGDDLLYAQTARHADRERLLHAAVDLLATLLERREPDGAWWQAAYLLYQAPRTKKGSDATIRVFLVAVGTLLLGAPPVLPDAVDLAAYVLGQQAFLEALPGSSPHQTAAIPAPGGRADRARTSRTTRCPP